MTSDHKNPNSSLGSNLAEQFEAIARVLECAASLCRKGAITMEDESTVLEAYFAVANSGRTDRIVKQIIGVAAMIDRLKQLAPAEPEVQRLAKRLAQLER